ncbi:hypothetical protein Sango_2953300 [Sesamum angolense]|uniref:Retrotransposon Copia-like N-terminal domain-containing protein n=1 Tax=Sesamum angolense TaxID=2727404 RepID=A0AAE1VZM4_9LAMI|nr:hypothetical protein Sango_2953300 [Sesamum angolense]
MAGRERETMGVEIICRASMATELVEKTHMRDTTDDSLLENNVLFLHPSDHPGMALSSTPMDGTNFLPWTRVVYVLLGAKLKLGFIDGSFPQRCWICNF